MSSLTEELACRTAPGATRTPQLAVVGARDKADSQARPKVKALLRSFSIDHGIQAWSHLWNLWSQAHMEIATLARSSLCSNRWSLLPPISFGSTCKVPVRPQSKFQSITSPRCKSTNWCIVSRTLPTSERRWRRNQTTFGSQRHLEVSTLWESSGAVIDALLWAIVGISVAACIGLLIGFSSDSQETFHPWVHFVHHLGHSPNSYFHQTWANSHHLLPISGLLLCLQSKWGHQLLSRSLSALLAFQKWDWVASTD